MVAKCGDHQALEWECLASETTYEYKQFATPEKLSRQMVGRHSHPPWAIDYGLRHVRRRRRPAQHHDRLWDGCADRAMGHDRLSRGPRDPYASDGLAGQPARTAEPVCPGRARHHRVDGPVWPGLEYGIAHCLPHRAGRGGRFGDDDWHGDALRGLSP